MYIMGVSLVRSFYCSTPRCAHQRETVCMLRLFATPWTIAHQAPLSVELYWNGLPFPPPGDLANPGIEPASPSVAGGFFTTEPPHYIQ